MFREVKAWLFCFCTKYETIAHAQEATRQLNMFVGSTIFVDACGRHASDVILSWLANSFFVHAEGLFFANRKHLRCFDEYVNSVVEQQHAAVKTVRGTATFKLCLWRLLALPVIFYSQDKYRYQSHLQPRYISAMYELQSGYEGDVRYRRNIGRNKGSLTLHS
jgi:hypothetical protein